MMETASEAKSVYRYDAGLVVATPSKMDHICGRKPPMDMPRTVAMMMSAKLKLNK